MNNRLQSNITIILLVSNLFAAGCSTVPDRTVPGMPVLKAEKKSADNYAIDLNSQRPANMQSHGTNELDSLTAIVPGENFDSGSATGNGKNESEEIMIPIKIFKRGNADKRLSIRDYQNAVVTIFTAAGNGAGFIITEDGYVLTNQHVVSGERFVNVKLVSGKKTNGEVIRTDAIGDVALIKLEKGLYPYVYLGNSALLDIGEEVFVIGAPFNDKLTRTVTNGIVNTFRMEKGLRYIQSDITVRGSDSGSPLVSLRHGVVGICTARYSFHDSDTGEKINQIIPVEDAIKMLNIKDDEIAIQNIEEII